MEFRKWIEQATSGYELDMGIFSSEQVQALQKMRDIYQADEHRPVEYRRLQFVRWLVTTGKLTDQIEETRS